MLFSSLCTFQYVAVCVILILGQTAAVVIFYKFPQVVSNKGIRFYNDEGKYQESIQSSTTPEPRHHMGKLQKTINYHTLERQEAR